MVTGENNNKFYTMTEKNGGIEVEYGRVDSTSTKKTYSLWEWDKIYNSKVKKGYVDVTDMITVTTDTTTKAQSLDIGSGLSSVDTFLELMQKYTNNLVSTTYTVKAVDVSQKQVDQAQVLIDTLRTLLVTKTKDDDLNKVLLQLYTIIPRKMNNVRDYLVPTINLNKTIDQEQDNLDAMALQVKMLAPSKTTAKMSKKNVTLIQKLGIKIKETKDYSRIKHITDQLSGRKIVGVYEIEKNAEDVIFSNWVKKSKNKETRMLIHGTRCASVVPILEQGLKIRPAGNFQFSGKAYGDGNYFSEVTNKSLGYTGNDPDKILFVYEVHTGNPFKYQGWYKGNDFSLNYTELSKRGFDSTHVSAGNGLLNSEIIAYKEEQARVRYIIHLK
jgi:poly [ADP-ribose] polymerase